ncbi:MAG: TIGR00730 family Rossman fold protein [Hyphomicrobiaceae bacterium]|nr:MAG: TIGR00730 family Rossman fold protein [Hyphomicrobiaceae bacterium]
MRNSKGNGARLANGAAAAATKIKKAAVQAERNVCVYCGSGQGRNPKYKHAARALGRALAGSGIGLVYGGGGLGLMGETAKSVLAAGGNVTGIIPHFLSEREHMLQEVDEIIVTADMHERKRLMFERSDAFVALPGGIGTLEELVEQLTWAQLGRHSKPIILANIDNFWGPLLGLLAHMKSEEFIREGLEVRFLVVDRAQEIVPTLQRVWTSTGETIETADVARKF